MVEMQDAPLEVLDELAATVLLLLGATPWDAVIRLVDLGCLARPTLAVGLDAVLSLRIEQVLTVHADRTQRQAPHGAGNEFRTSLLALATTIQDVAVRGAASAAEVAAHERAAGYRRIARAMERARERDLRAAWDELSGRGRLS